MANITIELDVTETVDAPKRKNTYNRKICKFTIVGYSDGILELSPGDEIAFDLVESREYFYVTISRKVYIDGANDPFYIVCVPHVCNGLDQCAEILERFKAQFGESVVVEANAGQDS